MIESILGDLLTVFLDILIFNPSHPKTSKKRRLIRLILNPYLHSEPVNSIIDVR